MPSARGEQRIRYKQDIADYAGQLQAQQAAHQADIIAHDTKAAQVFKTQAELEMARESHQARMERVPLEMERIKWQTRASEASARRALQQELLETRKQTMMEEDEAGFLEHMNQVNAPPGTKEFAEGVWKGATEFPFVPTQTRAQYLGMAKIKADPETIITQAQELNSRMGGKGSISLRMDSDGGFLPTISSPPPVNPNAVLTGLRSEVRRHQQEITATRKQMETTTSPADKAKLSERLGELQKGYDSAVEKHLNALEGGTPERAEAPATPSFMPGATAVKNGITYVRGDDGKWLPK
jgi:hypothetical protein